MLRRKNYTPEEPDNAKTAIGRQLTGVHDYRLGMVSSNDGNALNEVEPTSPAVDQTPERL